MPLSTTYLLPAVLLNPAVILHLLNTLVSRVAHFSLPAISHSPHPFMESLGPVPGAALYWDVHADDALCWTSAVVMVLVQVLAFRRVSSNRVQGRISRAARAGNEKSWREHVEAVYLKSKSLTMNSGLDGAEDSMLEVGNPHPRLEGYETTNDEDKLNGATHTLDDLSTKAVQTIDVEAEDEASWTETSEEEMMS